MDTQKYEDAISDEYTLQCLAESKENLKSFITDRLEELHQREDYREVLHQVLIYLGDAPASGVKFMAPGAMHRARWMAKMIYTFKVWMFQGQFQLTAHEEKGLRDLCLFYSVIYLKSWFECPLAACAQ